MKTFIKAIVLIFSCTAVLSSCAKRTEEEPATEGYAFRVEGTSVAGTILADGLGEAPVVSLTVLDGADVDYFAIFTVDGGTVEYTQHNLWLGRSRMLTFDMTEEYTSMGSHVVSGKVLREDGFGGGQVFEVSYVMKTGRVLGVSDIVFESAVSGYGRYAGKVDAGKVLLPAGDTGRVSLRVYPDNANLAKVSCRGAVEFDTAKAVAGADGYISAPYRVKSAGQATVVADWGDGTAEFSFSCIQYPTLWAEFSAEYDAARSAVNLWVDFPGWCNADVFPFGGAELQGVTVISSKNIVIRDGRASLGGFVLSGSELTEETVNVVLSVDFADGFVFMTMPDAISVGGRTINFIKGSKDLNERFVYGEDVTAYATVKE